jgi:(p)ppGpp synthase/HD superfamily hydrolase
LAFAADQFRYRIRKGSGVPYLTHLLHVMVTVGEHGGDEDQMIAAVLHDYLEDIDGARRHELEQRFGERVAWFVEALSDSTTHPKPPWQQRKQSHLDAVRHEPPEVKLLFAADKLHNAQSLVRDLARIGSSTWDRFTATPEQTLWYYRAAVDALAAGGWEHPALDELRSAVRQLHDRTGHAYDG